MAKPVNAGDELQITTTFLFDGVATQPNSATYRVEDVSTGQVIRQDTAISPIAAEVTIILTYDDNQMQNSGSDAEFHELIVVANFGTDNAEKPRQVTGSYKYQVQRSP